LLICFCFFAVALLTNIRIFFVAELSHTNSIDGTSERTDGIPLRFGAAPASSVAEPVPETQHVYLSLFVVFVLSFSATEFY
jgi:hypothetical protein